MKTQLDKFWVAKERRKRLSDYTYEYFIQLHDQDQFEANCRTLLGADVLIEWREDGSCVVAGIMLFLPLDTT